MLVGSGLLRALEKGLWAGSSYVRTLLMNHDGGHEERVCSAVEGAGILVGLGLGGLHTVSARREWKRGRENVLVGLGIQSLYSQGIPNQIARGLGRFRRNHDPSLAHPLHSPNNSTVYVQGYISQASQTPARQGTDAEPHDGVRDGGSDDGGGLKRFGEGIVVIQESGDGAVSSPH